MTALARMARQARLPLFRNAYALLASSLLTGALGIAYWAIAARLFPSAEVGIGATLVSAIMFVGSVSQLNLRSAMYRYLPLAGNRAFRLVAIAYGFIVVSAILIGTGVVVANVVFDLLAIAPEPTLAAMAIFVASCVAWSLFSFQDHVLTSLRLSMWVPAENLAFALVKIALLVAFIGLGPYGVYASWVVSALLGVLAVSGAIALVLWRRRRPNDEGAELHLKPIARYAAADYLAGVFSSIGTALLPPLVFITLGAAASAYFYVVWLIAMTLRLAPIAMLTSLMVETSHGQASFETDARHVVGQALVLMAIPIAVLLVAAPWILAIFGQDYADAGATSMRILALAAIPYTMNALAVFYARSSGSMRTVIVIEATMAIPTLLGAVALAPALGLDGVALAVLVTQATVALTIARPIVWPLFSRWIQVFPA